MRKYKKKLVIILFLALLVIINSILNFILVPSTITRVIMHEIESEHDYKCIFLGTSHGSYGIDSNKVTEVLGSKTMNLCIGGEYLQDSYYLLKRAFETNKPDTIILDMDFEYLLKGPNSSLSGSSIYNLYPFSINKMSYFKDKVLGLDYRAAFFPWMDYRDNFSSALSVVKTKMSADYINYSVNAVKMNANNEYKHNGFLYRERSTHPKIQNHLIWDESNVDQKAVQYLNKIVDLCKSNNTKIIMMTTPVPVEEITYSIDEYEQAYAYVSKLAKANNIEFYNFNLLKESVFQRNIGDYNDYDGHMYGDTAERFSEILGRFLKDVQDGQVTLSDYFYDSIIDLQ